MSEASSDGGTQDEELLADLFDTLLQEILEGRTPDLEDFHADRPDLKERIAKTWSLACSVAGRREPSRPVFGGYEILRELGHGGMGTVYLARHQTLQREVAVKVLPQSLAMSPRAKQRFVEEARALAQIRHQHVVHIHRIVDHTEMLAFEMEYIDGLSLRQLVLELRQHDKPHAIQSLAEVIGVDVATLATRNSVEWFVRVGIRMARALGEVHRHGLVHRDVKPSNILLRKDGTPVLADFGLALSDFDNKSSKFAGTPVYAAPERLRGGEVDSDARTDVYSLGVTLHETLTLKAPFQGNSTHEVLRRIEAGRMPSLRAQAPHVSHDLATIVSKAMEPDPRHRYATADEFADDLERLLNLQPIQATPAGPLRRATKFVRRHQKSVLAAAISALVVAMVAWPLAVMANGRQAARTTAAAARHEARTQLLSQESLPPWWDTSAANGRTIRQTRGRAARRTALEHALSHYERAVDATPEDALLRLEVTAVWAAHAQLVDTEPHSAAPDNLPPLANSLTHGTTAGGRLTAALLRQLDDASGEQRFAAGLFAFLIGDRPANEACWQALPATLAGDPLVDACIALRAATEENAAFAYPRVFHAAREFPAATALVVAMADGAVHAGDLAMAKHWFAAIPTATDEVLDARRRLLAADLQAAAGELEQARRSYRELILDDPTDPRPLLRLASLAMAGNDMVGARRLWQSMLRRWPDLAPARRQLARLCLQYRDLPGYLRHVQQAMRQQVGNRKASGEVDELLRLGGLQRAGSPATRGAEPGRAFTALPLTTWLPRVQVAGVERVLDILPVLDEIGWHADRIDRRPVGASLIGVGLAALRFPDITARLPLPARLALAGIPGLLGRPVNYMTDLLLPYQTSLGSRLHTLDDRRLYHQEHADRTVFYGLQAMRVGDLDGDTLPEICVSAPPADRHTGGYIELRSLDEGSLLRTWRGPPGGELFARAIADLGDVDGDLCTDVLIGIPVTGRDPTQLASLELRSGRTGTQIWHRTDSYSSFGVALAALGDIDGDGLRDFVVGIPPLTAKELGRAWICSGRDGGRLHELRADRRGVWFGGAVANAGDLTGDGIDEVLVGGNYGRAEGLVVVFDGATGSPHLTFTDDDQAARFGEVLVSLGDVDDDGIDDFAIGAPGSPQAATTTGSVLVISGRSGNSLCELHGERLGEGFGRSLCALPTWRRNKHAALAVGTRRGGPIGNGYVRVFELPSGQPLQTFAGSPAHAWFGYSLVDLGDRDDDGLRDLGIMVLSRGQRAGLWVMSFADIQASTATPVRRDRR